MPKTRQQKEDLVVKFSDKLNRANSIVFVDYQGLTMAQLSDIRSKLAEIGAELTVTKNNLLKIALKEQKIELSDDILKGPIATLFGFADEIAPIKVVAKELKDLKIGSIKAGILDGELLDQYAVVKLSQLPSKDELRAKIVGSLASPLYGMVNVLQGNLRNLVYALEQIRKSKGGE